MTVFRFYVARINDCGSRWYAAMRDKYEIQWIPYHLVDGRWVSSSPWVHPIEFETAGQAEAFIALRKERQHARFTDLLAVVHAHDHQIVEPAEVEA